MGGQAEATQPGGRNSILCPVRVSGDQVCGLSFAASHVHYQKAGWGVEAGLNPMGGGGLTCCPTMATSSSRFVKTEFWCGRRGSIAPRQGAVDPSNTRGS